MILVYTDGSAKNNPNGESGWGAVIVYPSGQVAQHCGYLGVGSNNQAELKGFIEGVRRTDPATPIKVFLDSKYVLDGMTRGWVKNWQRNGWKTAKGTPVANRELWEDAVEIVKGRNISYEWVKAHNGNEYNEMADKLADAAITTRINK